MTDTKLALMNEMYLMTEELNNPNVSNEYLDSVLALLSSKLSISEVVTTETQIDLLKNLTKLKEIDMKKRRKKINQDTIKQTKAQGDLYKKALNYATAVLALDKEKDKAKTRLQEHFKMPKEKTIELKLEVPEMTETLLRAMAAKAMINTFQIVEIRKDIKAEGLDTAMRNNFNHNELETINVIINTLNSRYAEGKKRTKKLF